MAQTTHPKALPDVLTGDNLPSLPPVALDVLRLARSEESGAAELAASIRRDPVLAAKLLRVANSALFRPEHPVATLEQATMVLGFRGVMLTALSFSLLDDLSGAQRPGLSLLEFWSRSLTSAVAGRSLARRIGDRRHDEAFLCGLLGHLGRLVLAQCMPDEYAGVLHECGDWPSLDEEDRALGFSSADVCATLLRDWDLPELVWIAASFGDRPEQLPSDADDDVRALVELVGAARLVEPILCGGLEGPAVVDLLVRLSGTYGLEPHESQEFLAALAPAVAEMAEILNVPLPHDLSLDDVLDRARVEMIGIGVRTSADLEQTQRLARELEDQNEALAREAFTDRLTGLHGRSSFSDFLARQVQARIRTRLPGGLGLILLDVDRFKGLNDAHGHQAGDAVLCRLGGLLKRRVRAADLAARYGGDEFAVVVPHATASGLRSLADQLREAIAKEVVEADGERLSVTVSSGAACVWNVSSESGPELIALADKCLYRAKSAGRNRGEIAQLGQP